MKNNKNVLNWQKEKLWNGCMLVSIAHSIMSADCPELAHENSWDGINYNIQDSQGTCGTITFSKNYCVGAFRNYSSDRLKDKNNIKLAKEYFRDAPNEVIYLARNEALLYLLDDIRGHDMPLITTAFWEEEGTFFTIDTNDDFYKNGAFLLELQLMDIYNAREAIIEEYEMSENQVKLMNKLVELKINKKIAKVELTKDDILQIESPDYEGILTSKMLFEQIGIILDLNNI